MRVNLGSFFKFGMPWDLDASSWSKSDVVIGRVDVTANPVAEEGAPHSKCRVVTVFNIGCHEGCPTGWTEGAVTAVRYIAVCLLKVFEKPRSAVHNQTSAESSLTTTVPVHTQQHAHAISLPMQIFDCWFTLSTQPVLSHAYLLLPNVNEVSQGK